MPTPQLCAKLREFKLELRPDSVIGRNLLFSGPIKVGANVLLLRVKLDAYTLIGNHSSLTTSAIGRYCTIGPDVEIGVGNHDISGLTSSNAFQINTPFHRFTGVIPKRLNPTQRRTGEDTSENTIGHDVFIGAQCTITNNVTIGTGAVIGAHSVINHDVPPYAVVAGKGGGKNSLHIIKRYRFSDEIIADLLESKWWEYDLPLLQRLYQRQGKRLPLHNIKDFLALMRNEDISSWPRLSDRWLYMRMITSNEAQLLCVNPDINMGHLYSDEMRRSPDWL